MDMSFSKNRSLTYPEDGWRDHEIDDYINSLVKQSFFYVPGVAEGADIDLSSLLNYVPFVPKYLTCLRAVRAFVP